MTADISALGIPKGYNRAPHPDRIPGTPNLIGADVQVWHNAKPTGSRSPLPEWNVKLTTWSCAASEIASRAGANWFIAFRDPRRLRAKLKHDLDAGRVSAAWIEQITRASGQASGGALIGLITYKLDGQHGSQAQMVIEGQFALLELDADGAAPIRIDLHLDLTSDVLPVTTFVTASATVQAGRTRKDRSPGWIAYHGEARLQARRERIAFAKHERQREASARHSPITEIGTLINMMLKERIDTLVTDLVANCMALEQRMTSMEEAITMWEARMEEKIDAISAWASASGYVAPDTVPALLQ